MKIDNMLTILTPSIGPDSVLLRHYEWFSSLHDPRIRLVIIDQNSRGESKTLTNLSTSDQSFEYIYSENKGLSLNRNIGLDYVNTKYVIFLDDDARVENNFFNKFFDYQSNNVDVNIFLCAVVNKDLTLTSYTPFDGEVEVNVGNVENKVNSNGLVVNVDSLKSIKFDKRMGVGSIYGACEEVDLVVRSLLSGAKVKYTSSLKVIHPVPDFGINKSYSYGKGHGFFTFKLLKYAKHYRRKSIGILLILKLAKFLVKLSLCLFIPFNKKFISKYYWCKGFCFGFFCAGKETTHYE